MQQKRWALSLPLDNFTLAEHPDIICEMERLGILMPGRSRLMAQTVFLLSRWPQRSVLCDWELRLPMCIRVDRQPWR